MLGVLQGNQERGRRSQKPLALHCFSVNNDPCLYRLRDGKAVSRAKCGFRHISEPNGSPTLHSSTDGHGQHSTRERSQLYLNTERRCRKIKKQLNMGKTSKLTTKGIGLLGGSYADWGLSSLQRGVSTLPAPLFLGHPTLIM